MSLFSSKHLLPFTQKLPAMFLAVPLRNSSKCRAKAGRERTGLNSYKAATTWFPWNFSNHAIYAEVLSIPDMTKSKYPGNLDSASGLKFLGDQAGHTEQLQNDLRFLWDYINSNKECLAETMRKSHNFMIEIYTVLAGNGKVHKTMKNQGSYIR